MSMLNETIVVTGGTGKTGRRVAERLQARGVPVRSVSRSTEPSLHWEDRRTWAPALDGAAAAYITFYPDLAVPGSADLIGSLAALTEDGHVGKLLDGRNQSLTGGVQRALGREPREFSDYAQRAAAAGAWGA